VRKLIDIENSLLGSMGSISGLFRIINKFTYFSSLGGGVSFFFCTAITNMGRLYFYYYFRHYSNLFSRFLLLEHDYPQEFCKISFFFFIIYENLFSSFSPGIFFILLFIFLNIIILVIYWVYSIPSMAIGACIGRAMGIFVQIIQGWETSFT